MAVMIFQNKKLAVEEVLLKLLESAVRTCMKVILHNITQVKHLQVHVMIPCLWPQGLLSFQRMSRCNSTT